jgi:hypothetical protein
MSILQSGAGNRTIGGKLEYYLCVQYTHIVTII